MPAKPNGCPAARQLILVTGAPASGKSTLVARLAADYGWCCCCKDEIKELLLDSLGAPADAHGSRRLSDASFALMFLFADRLLRALPALLLEGNFRPGEHEGPLRQLCAAERCVSVQLLCVADPALREARLRARASDPSRHSGHGNRFLDAPSPGNDLAASGYLALPGARLQFDGGTDFDGAYAQLRRQLDHWLSSGSTSA